MKRAEMEYEAFLTTFMPTGAEGDLPSSIVEDIPPFDRAVLLGTAEKPICESLVREMLAQSTVCMVVDSDSTSVRGRTEDLRQARMPRRTETSSEEHEPLS